MQGKGISGTFSQRATVHLDFISRPWGEMMTPHHTIRQKNILSLDSFPALLLNVFSCCFSPILLSPVQRG